jgi:hypothetical protein
LPTQAAVKDMFCYSGYSFPRHSSGTILQTTSHLQYKGKPNQGNEFHVKMLCFPWSVCENSRNTFSFTRPENNRFMVGLARHTFYMMLVSLQWAKKFHATPAAVSQYLVPIFTQIQDSFQPGFVYVSHMLYSADQGTKRCRIRIIRGYVTASSV